MGASLRNHHYYSDVRATNNSQQLSSKASCSAPPFPHSLRKMTKDTEQKMWEREQGFIIIRFFFFSVPLSPCRPALSMEKYRSFTTTFSHLFGLNYNRIEGTSKKMFVNLNLICMSLFQFKSSWIVEALFVSVCKKVTICVPGSVLFQYPPIHPARPRHMQCIGFFDT